MPSRIRQGIEVPLLAGKPVTAYVPDTAATRASPG